MSIRPVLSATSAAAFLVSCGTASVRSSLKDFEIPASADKKISLLGTAYDSEKATFLSGQCVEGTKATVSPPDLGINIEFLKDADFNQVLKKIGGGIEADVNYPTVRVKGKARLASENSKTDLSNSYTLVANYVGQSVVLNPVDGSERSTTNPNEGYGLTELGQKAAQNRSTVRRVTYRNSSWQSDPHFS